MRLYIVASVPGAQVPPPPPWVFTRQDLGLATEDKLMLERQGYRVSVQEVEMPRPKSHPGFRIYLDHKEMVEHLGDTLQECKTVLRDFITRGDFRNEDEFRAAFQAWTACDRARKVIVDKLAQLPLPEAPEEAPLER